MEPALQDDAFIERLADWMDDAAHPRAILVDGETIAAQAPGFFIAWQLALERFQQRRGLPSLQAAVDASAAHMLISFTPDPQETPHDRLPRFLRAINEASKATDLEPGWFHPISEPPFIPIDLAIGSAAWLSTVGASASVKVALDAPPAPAPSQEATNTPVVHLRGMLWAVGTVAALGWSSLSSDLTPLLIMFGSGVVHEVAHAWTAKLTGDETAARAGRLNPFAVWRHLSLWGTVAMLASTAIFGSFAFGWMKPVLVNPRSQRQMQMIAFAGPIANLLLIIPFSIGWLAAAPLGFSTAVADIMKMGVIINGFIANLNLLPIPGFDGSWIWTPGVAGQLSRRSSLPALAVGAMTAAAFGLPVLCASCQAMQLQARLENAISDERDRRRMAEAAKQLNALMAELGRQLAEAAARDAAIQSQVDRDDAAHAATHAAEAALDEAIGSAAPTADVFEATFTKRLLPEMRAMAIKADEEATVRRLLESTRLLDGRTPQQALRRWLQDFNLLEAFQHAAAHKAGTPHHHAHPHRHDEEEGHGQGGAGQALASLGPLLAGGLLGWLTGAPFLRLSTQPAPAIPPLDEFLKTLNLPKDDLEFLRSVTSDLAQEAEAGRPLVGRSDELSGIMSRLSTPPRTKNSLILVGPRGVGKTALVELVALKLAKGEARGHLKGRRIVALKAGALGSGPQLLDNLPTLIAIVEKTNNRLILFMDEIHSLLKGPSNTVDSRAADLLKPVLEKGRVTLIGATTDAEYKAYIEQDKAFEDRFSKIFVRESSLPETVGILQGIKGYLERKFGMRIDRGALMQVAHGSERYIPEKSQPRKAIDTLEAAISRVNAQANSLQLQQEDFLGRLQAAMNDRIELRKQGLAEDATELVEVHNRIIGSLTALHEVAQRMAELRNATRITDEDVLAYLADSTGIPVEKLGEEDAAKYLRMEAELHKRVIGQEEAVRAISQVVRRNMTDMRDQKRPVGVFYLAGTTGVGKTELAKALAEFLFGEEAALLRFDMTEYQQEHTVARLIGAPPGYIGHEQGGQLTEAVRKRPYSVLLFDEIEKAHPKVLELLMQVFDDGRLTDGQGHTVDFTNTIILLSSNIGMHEIQEPLRALSQQLTAAETPEASTVIIADMNRLVAQAVSDTIRQRYKPEIVNRIDRIIPYQVLTPDHVRHIARIQVARALAPLAEKGYALNIKEGLYTALAKPGRGYDVLNGARPLRRLIEQEISTPLSTYLLEETAQGRTTHGGTLHLSVDAQDHPTFRFEPRQAASLRVEPAPELAGLFQQVIQLAEQVVDSPQETVELEQLARLINVKRAAPQGEQLSGQFGAFWARTPIAIPTPRGERRSNHNDPKRKDSAIDGLADTLARQNFGAENLVLAEPWLREFVRLAKTYNTNASIGLMWGVEADGARLLAIHREGGVSAEEEAWLRAHLTPEVAGPEQATEIAQQLVAQGVPNVRRGLLELKATLAVAGATFGFSEDETTVTYWLKLPAALGLGIGAGAQAPPPPAQAFAPAGIHPTQEHAAEFLRGLWLRRNRQLTDPRERIELIIRPPLAEGERLGPVTPSEYRTGPLAWLYEQDTAKRTKIFVAPEISGSELLGWILEMHPAYGADRPFKDSAIDQLRAKRDRLRQLEAQQAAPPAQPPAAGLTDAQARLEAIDGALALLREGRFELFQAGKYADSQNGMVLWQGDMPNYSYTTQDAEKLKEATPRYQAAEVLVSQMVGVLNGGLLPGQWVGLRHQDDIDEEDYMISRLGVGGPKLWSKPERREFLNTMIQWLEEQRQALQTTESSAAPVTTPVDTLQMAKEFLGEMRWSRGSVYFAFEVKMGDRRLAQPFQIERQTALSMPQLEMWRILVSPEQTSGAALLDFVLAQPPLRDDLYLAQLPPAFRFDMQAKRDELARLEAQTNRAQGARLKAQGQTPGNEQLSVFDTLKKAAQQARLDFAPAPAMRLVPRNLKELLEAASPVVKTTVEASPLRFKQLLRFDRGRDATDVIYVRYNKAEDHVSNVRYASRLAYEDKFRTQYRLFGPLALGAGRKEWIRDVAFRPNPKRTRALQLVIVIADEAREKIAADTPKDWLILTESEALARYEELKDIFRFEPVPQPVPDQQSTPQPPPAFGRPAYFSGGAQVQWGSGGWLAGADGGTRTIVRDDPAMRQTADWNPQRLRYVINGGVPVFTPDAEQHDSRGEPVEPVNLGAFRSPAAALAAGVAAVDAGARKPPPEVMQRLGLDFDEALQMILIPPLPVTPEVAQRLRTYQRQLAVSA